VTSELPGARAGRSHISNLHAHLVFSTKYRRKALTAEILDYCRDIMAEVCSEHGATLTEFNGEADHVHMLVHYPPTLALSVLVKALKGRSSRLLRQQFRRHLKRVLWGDALWTPAYFAGSCGGAPLTVVQDYINNQRRPD